MVNINELYKYRSCANDLYKKESSLKSDFGTSIENMYNREDSKIDKVNMDIESCDINFTLKEDSEEVYNDIVSEIGTNIKKFLIENVDESNIASTDKEGFINFVNNGESLFEAYKIGNQVHILL